MRAAGYQCAEYIAGERATHIFLRKRAWLAPFAVGHLQLLRARPSPGSTSYRREAQKWKAVKYSMAVILFHSYIAPRTIKYMIYGGQGWN
jgi:hypothetical protein